VGIGEDSWTRGDCTVHIAFEFFVINVTMTYKPTERSIFVQRSRTNALYVAIRPLQPTFVNFLRIKFWYHFLNIRDSTT